MKKNLFSLGVLAAAAIALAGCAKTESNVPEVKGTGISFEFIATGAMTKTTNDGEATNWVAGDQVNLFHAVAGETEYVNDNAFTASEDGTEVKFTGELAEALDASSSYDWYAFYPYTSQVTTPANTTAGYVYLGSRSDRSQIQNGNSNLDHIAGANYPIAGIATDVAGDETPSISMVHLSSLIEVTVNNKTANPITVTDISFVGTEDIVGSYFVDFASDPIVFTPSKTTYVSNTAKLTVEDGDPIAANDYAYFYLAVKPFTAKSGEKLTLKVTTDEYGTQEVEKTLTADAVFEGGHENFFTFNYTKADELKPIDVVDLVDVEAGEQVLVEGQVTALSTKGFILTDATASVFVYSNKDESKTYSIGQNVSVKGELALYQSCIQIANPDVTAGEADSYDYPDPEKFTEDVVNTYNNGGARLATYMTCTGTLVKGSSYWNLKVGSVSTANGTLYYQIQDMSGFNDGDVVTMTGYAINVMSGRCAVVPTEIELKVVPKITWDAIDMVEADGVTDASLALTPSNVDGWTAGVTRDGTVVTAATINSDCTKITYTVSENTGTQKRAGTITVIFTKSGEDDVVYTITISQKAPEAAGTATVTLTGTNMSNMEGGNNYGDIKSGTFDGFTWTSNGYRTAALQNMLQVRVRTNSNGVSYIQLPTFPGNIQSVSMKVTTANSSSYTTDNCSATLAVQSGTTSSEDVLVSGQVSNNEITLDLSSENVKTGYIVSTEYSARIWEVTVVYNK